MQTMSNLLITSIYADYNNLKLHSNYCIVVLCCIAFNWKMILQIVLYRLSSLFKQCIKGYTANAQRIHNPEHIDVLNLKYYNYRLLIS